MRVSERGRENSQESKQTCVSPCLFPSDAWPERQKIGFPNYCIGCMDLRRILDAERFIPRVFSQLNAILEGWTRIEISPPIHFRIEWARGQGNVTALWQRAHFN